MAGRIAIIQGHPDSRENHFGHALAASYAKGARESGREVRLIEVAKLDFPLLRSKEEWETQPPPECLKESRETIAWADHVLILFPLWLGTMPAILKGFLEQVLRPGFAFESMGGKFWKKLLKGRSARIVVTMGMPAFVYRWYFRSHGLKNLERNILRFCGIAPVSNTLIGMVEANEKSRETWLVRLEALGRKGL